MPDQTRSVRFSLLDRFVDPDSGPRRHPVVWTAVFCALQVGEEVALDRFADPNQIVGLTGALSVLLAVVAAIVVGVRSGVVVALVGTVAFHALVADLGETAPLSTSLVAGSVWIAAAVLAGVVADNLRDEIVARRGAREAIVRLHERLSRNLLPSVPATVGGCRIATFYQPGEERIELGGDFYDAVGLPDGSVAVLIGDVSGHGPEAASLGAMLRAAWQALVRAGVAPDTLVRSMAEVLVHEAASDDRFATLCMSQIDTTAGIVRTVLLGHPAPILMGETVVPLVVRPLPPLGVVDLAHIRAEEHPLPAGWHLVFYTDGLVEGRATPGAVERYGIDRLVGRLTQVCVVGNADPASEECLAAVVADAQAANGGPLPDDVTALVVSAL